MDKKEALEYIELNPQYFSRNYEPSFVEAVKKALQEPDYKALCEEMADVIWGLQSIYIYKTSGHREKYSRATKVLNKWEAITTSKIH